MTIKPYLIKTFLSDKPSEPTSARVGAGQFTNIKNGAQNDYFFHKIYHKLD
jgi:hypothetical protein